MAFRFRQFLVEDEKSTLRVGTDAMLLGAWTKPGAARRILDIGTGCGVLALMMAQQSDALIEAIDLDLPSVLEARDNFSHSPWNDRLTAINDTIQNFSTYSSTGYDLIIANPPFFSNSLKSPSARKNRSRHDDGLTLEALGLIAEKLLSQHGRFSVILPSETAAWYQLLLERCGLHMIRRMVIYPKPASPSRRTLMEFSKQAVNQAEETELTILDPSGKFSLAYLTLTHSFHQF